MLISVMVNAVMLVTSGVSRADRDHQAGAADIRRC
jgi:hypothetical protein